MKKEEVEPGEWVAQVVSSGEYGFPSLEWRSADVSLGAAIGTKLYASPSASVPATSLDHPTEAKGKAFHATTDAEDASDGIEDRLKVQSGPFKGKPQQWFTRAQVVALLDACGVQEVPRG